MSQSRTHTHAHALTIVQKFFPNVKSVRDATSPITIEVTKADNNNSKVRSHSACAMAVACKRAEHADGVIVSIMTAYVIKGTSATRYVLPESVSREIVSFDREAGFAPGEYVMRPPEPSKQLGVHRGGKSTHTKNGKKITRHHHTSGIRTVLGSRVQGDIGGLLRSFAASPKLAGKGKERTA